MPDLTFAIPEGFTPPEHMDSDKTFQAMATFRMVGDDELELVDIEGYQVGEEDTEGDTEAAKQTEQQNVASALAGAGSAASSETNLGGPPGAPPSAPPASQAGFAQRMGQRFREVTGRR